MFDLNFYNDPESLLKIINIANTGNTVLFADGGHLQVTIPELDDDQKAELIEKIRSRGIESCAENSILTTGTQENLKSGSFPMYNNHCIDASFIRMSGYLILAPKKVENFLLSFINNFVEFEIRTGVREKIPLTIELSSPNADKSCQLLEQYINKPSKQLQRTIDKSPQINTVTYCVEELFSVCRAAGRRSGELYLKEIENVVIEAKNKIAGFVPKTTFDKVKQTKKYADVLNTLVLFSILNCRNAEDCQTLLDLIIKLCDDYPAIIKHDLFDINECITKILHGRMMFAKSPLDLLETMQMQQQALIRLEKSDFYDCFQRLLSHPQMRQALVVAEYQKSQEYLKTLKSDYHIQWVSTFESPMDLSTCFKEILSMESPRTFVHDANFILSVYKNKKLNLENRQDYSSKEKETNRKALKKSYASMMYALYIPELIRCQNLEDHKQLLNKLYSAIDNQKVIELFDKEELTGIFHLTLANAIQLSKDLKIQKKMLIEFYQSDFIKLFTTPNMATQELNNLFMQTEEDIAECISGVINEYTGSVDEYREDNNKVMEKNVHLLRMMDNLSPCIQIEELNEFAETPLLLTNTRVSNKF